jgi:molybdopterin converting factor subunit 1
MMHVTVLLFAAYREAAGSKKVTLELPADATLGSAWTQLAAQYPRLAVFSSTVVGAVNGEYARLDTVLSDGDEIAYLPPVAGGDHFALTDAPIDEAALRNAVSDPGAGAVLIFLGTTRNQTGGRQVDYLEYEAYPDMAERRMAAIAQEIRERWGSVKGVALVHRVGRVEIGEASIGIAVATPHRGDAFAACRYAIDRAKEHLPIWKKEVWEGGAEWIEEGPGYLG